jgi:hypothetical protein
VDLSDLTPREADAPARRLQPMLGYLVRLSDRMQKRGWRADDPAYLAAWRRGTGCTNCTSASPLRELRAGPRWESACICG